MKSISYSIWEKTYRPIVKNGSYVDFDSNQDVYKDIIRKATGENKLWTECYSEDFYIIPGISIVNRIALYITEKPCNIDLQVFNIINETKFHVPKKDLLSLAEKLEKEDPGTFSVEEIELGDYLYLDQGDTEEYQPILDKFCRAHKKALGDTLELYTKDQDYI